MNMPDRVAGALLAVATGLAAAASVLAASVATAPSVSAQTDTDICRLVQVKPAEVTFIGRVVSDSDGFVVFAVERVTTGTLGKNLKDGKVTILYPNQEDRFLEVGQSYRVPADTTSYGLTSSVHTADHPCKVENTTVHADGSVIQTGVLAHAKGPFLRYLGQIAVGFTGLFALIWLLSRLARKARGD